MAIREILFGVLIDNYHGFKQSSQFVAPKVNRSGLPGRMRSNNVLFC